MSRTVPPLSSTSSSASLPASSGLSTPEEALSASTVSSAPSSRLSHLSSSSGALSQRTMQSYRTVSLPGLFPGTHLGVLASGMLDKRRDGAVRGGWAKRLFVLSTRSLHYYRKTEDFELFGKERGQVPLADMGYAKLVAPEDAPYGAIEANATAYFCAVLSKRKSLLLFLRADSLAYAQSWVNVLNYALQTAKAVAFAPMWSLEAMQTFIAAASSNFQDVPQEPATSEDAVDSDEHATTQDAPKVLVISVASTTDFSPQTTTERVVKRQVELSSEVKLGAFRKRDFCILVLSDGEELHIPHHMLGSDVTRLLVDEKELVLTTPPRSQEARPTVVTTSRVHVRFRCVRQPPLLLSPQPSTAQPLLVNQPSVFVVVFPGALGGLFLLSVLIAFYCASPFEELMKITIVLGVLLSVSQIAQFGLAQMEQSEQSIASAQLAAKTIDRAAATAAHRSDDLVFYLRVDHIEVVELDQEVKELSRSTEEDASTISTSSGVESAEDGDVADAKISGGPLPFSARFIAAEKGDEEKGRQRYQHTLQWRQENRIDNILVTPHPTFATIKQHYPQYFHGRSKAGQPVYYERPGKIDLAALKREGLSIDDLLRHYMYITEYLWRVIEPTDTGRSLTVLDVSGIGMYDLGGEVLDFIKRASAFTGAHYPERSAHIFIINIPGWFNMIWRMVKPMIDPVTREKVHMLKGSAILRELETLIDSDNIPRDLGGKGPALGESDEEIALAAHVNRYLGSVSDM